MRYVFVKDKDEKVPINNIFCIGRNYVDHIRELNNQIEKEPLVFLKPNSALNTNTIITLPTFSDNIHYETELVLLINKDGKNIPIENAIHYVGAYAVGLDLTARDLQNNAKQKGLPWTLAKGFDNAATVSSFLSAGQMLNRQNFTFSMQLNTEIRQRGDTANMIFSIPFLINYLSEVFTLTAGDLIFTGTPSGVGQLQQNDKINLLLNNQFLADFIVK